MLVLSQLPIPGPPTTFITHTFLIIPLRPSNTRPQYNQYQPSIDGTHINERFGNNENKNQLNQPNLNQANAATYNSDTYFVNQQNSDPQTNKPTVTSKPLYQQSQSNPSQGPSDQSLYFMKEKNDPTTYRTSPKFDRTSMMTSEEYTQRPGSYPVIPLREI